MFPSKHVKLVKLVNCEDTKFSYYSIYGAPGGVVVKALLNKPAGRGFDSRWCQDFSP